MGDSPPFLLAEPSGGVLSFRPLTAVTLFLATDLTGYNGGIAETSQTPPPNSELAIARSEHLTTQSYLLNAIFTHKSARYAVEGVLHGFATDVAVGRAARSKSDYVQ